jgi:hypothetical protein
MPTQHERKYWIDPQSDALAFLKRTPAACREDREIGNATAPHPRPPQDAKRQGTSADDGKTIDAEFEDLGAIATGAQGLTPGTTPGLVPAKTKDVLPPEHLRPLPMAPEPPKPPEPAFSPALDLAPMERTIRQMMGTLDFQLPEGLLDAFFGRRNHRMTVKIERAELITRFQAAVTAKLQEQCNAAEEIRRHNQIRYQQVLDALIFWRTAAEEHYRLFLARERIEHERAIEAAKTQAEIAKYEREVRDTRRDLVPPAPPQPAPPPPTPEEIAEARRTAARRERDEDVELKLDELDAAARLGEEKVSRAKAKAIEIYRRLDMRKDEKRSRIVEILTAYELNEGILPEALRELLEEDDTDQPYGGEQ